jgi:hypothetical protein
LLSVHREPHNATPLTAAGQAISRCSVAVTGGASNAQVVLGANTWMMYGSRKAAGDPSPWAATRVLEAWREGKAVRVRPGPVPEARPPALARLLSVHRTLADASPLTAAGRAVEVCAPGGEGAPTANFGRRRHAIRGSRARQGPPRAPLPTVHLGRPARLGRRRSL